MSYTRSLASSMPAPKPSLSLEQQITRLRRDIDALDERLCDLIAKRFSCVSALSGLKPQGLPMLRPQREHEILERLKKRAKNQMPAEVLTGVWSTLMTSASFQQMPFSLAYAKSDALVNACRGAHFSAQIPQHPQNSASEAVALCMHKPSVFALVSFEQEDDKWWRLLSGSHAPRIVQSMSLAAKLSSDRDARVFLLGGVPKAFLDERAAIKYFLLKTKETLEISAYAKALNLPKSSLSVPMTDEEWVLLECCDTKQQDAETLMEALQILGEVRHLGSAHKLPLL